MYTNNEMNISDKVREHIEKGDTKFEFYFAERTFDKILIKQILSSLCEITLPENLNLILNFSTSNVEDNLVHYLFNMLTEINWPSKFKLTLLLRNNSIDNEAANILLDLFTRFNNSPGAEVCIDLDNNNILEPSVIDDALEKINDSTLIEDAVISKDKYKTVKFGKYLIQDFLSVVIDADAS